MDAAHAMVRSARERGVFGKLIVCSFEAGESAHRGYGQSDNGHVYGGYDHNRRPRIREIHRTDNYSGMLFNAFSGLMALRHLTQSTAFPESIEIIN